MTSAIIARRLIELCKQEKFLQAQHELYDDNIISIETDGSKTVGAANMNAKEQRFLDSIEKIISIDFPEPLIAGNYFTTVLKMEFELENLGCRKIEEICVYQVKNDKIVFEQFFHDLP